MSTATLHNPFKPATRYKLRLRMALCGPSGSGKSYTALRLAHGICAPGKKIACIDTEHKSLSKYIGESPDGIPWQFDVTEIASFAPSTYTDLMKAADRAGCYDVLIIDSLSHAWTGTDGALSIVDAQKNKFTDGWRAVTPMHNTMIDVLLRLDLHVIVTMRSKMEYVLETVNGKQVPKKVGLAPIQRQGMEYEFDVVGDIDEEHIITISKTRCRAMDKATAVKPSAAFMGPLIHWLNEGTPPPRELIDEAGITYQQPPPETPSERLAREKRELAAEKVAAAGQTAKPDANVSTAAPAQPPAVATEPPNGQPAKPKRGFCSEKLANDIRSLLRQAYSDPAEFGAMLAGLQVSKISELTTAQAKSVLAHVQGLAANRAAATSGSNSNGAASAPATEQPPFDTDPAPNGHTIAVDPNDPLAIFHNWRSKATAERDAALAENNGFASKAQRTRLQELVERLDVPDKTLQETLHAYKASTFRNLTVDEIDEVTGRFLAVELGLPEPPKN